MNYNKCVFAAHVAKNAVALKKKKSDTLGSYRKWSMCADCVCSAAGDCVFGMAMVRFCVKNAIGHVR